MNLLDGLRFYIDISESDWQFTLQVESATLSVLQLLSNFGDNPDAAAVAAAHSLLVEIEKWKAMCLKERMGNADRNSPRSVWDAFMGAMTAKTDVQAVLSIMRLTGFGSSQDEETGQRRAKVATAVLRFLMPDKWGVVDWRTIAILGFIDKAQGDIDEALIAAKKEKASVLRSMFDIVDEFGACEVNAKYRAMRSVPPLAKAADIDMALFGLSLIAWPMPNSVTAGAGQ